MVWLGHNSIKVHNLDLKMPNIEYDKPPKKIFDGMIIVDVPDKYKQLNRKQRRAK